MQYLPHLELIDRLCIARVKHQRTNGTNQTELDWYEEQYQHLVTELDQDRLTQLQYNINNIIQIHNQIWDLEWQLKTGVENLLSLEEIGRRAISIRDWNNKRVSFKNAISELFNSSFKEIKMDHLSADK